MPKGFIFRCNQKTKPEVFQRNLFGEELAIWGTMEKITPTDLLFLYNTITYEFTGPFKPASDCAKDIVKGAWNGKFPVQVRFEELPETKTIPFTKIQHIIKKFRNGIYPWPELDEGQTQRILNELC